MISQWKPIEIDGKYPFLIIDNWYDKEEENLIWNELNFLTNDRVLERAENTVTAVDELGKSKSSSFRIYLEEVYNNRNYSNILNFLNKHQNIKFHKIVEKTMPMGRSFKDTSHSTSLISYYEENDFYEEHYDVFLFTCLIWFHKEPKKYTGGDLYFSEADKTVLSKHNRMCFFPSYYLHKVLPLKWLEVPNKKGFGRYTITHFFYTQPLQT